MSYNGAFVRRIGCGTLKEPWDVSVHRGDVFVADTGNHRVAVFSQDGEFIRTIGSQGTGPGQFKYPTSVAISPNGELYVSDSNNGRAQELTPQVDRYHCAQIGLPKMMQWAERQARTTPNNV